MPQSHRLVSLTGRQFLDPHRLGCTLDAWASIAGGLPAALACLVAHRPGNMPGDLPGHLVGGAWSGHRLLMAGDYAEDRDAVPSYDGPPLSRLYRLLDLCEDLEHLPYRDPGGAWVTAADQAAEQRRELDALLAAVAPQGPFADVTIQLVGMVEHGGSVRLCGPGVRVAIPVQRRPGRDADGGVRYDLADRVRRDPEALGIIWRTLGWGGWSHDPAPDPDTLPPGVDRPPWDRPPAGLPPHDVPDGDADLGQMRLYANLDRGEYFDPAAFGEVPTLAGIVRAAYDGQGRTAMDFVLSERGVQADVRTGTPQFGSAGSLAAMLLHPEPRGGGDIDPGRFALVGAWRGDRILLTAETGAEFPTTDEVRGRFRNVSGDVLRSALASS